MTEKRLLPLLIIILLVSSLSPFALSQNSTIAFGSDEWIHVSVDGSHLESLHWTRIGSDIQVYFHEYNVSETIYDQFIIYANSTFTDPLHQFEAIWNGEFTPENKMLLSLSSIKGEVSVVITKFEAAEFIDHPPGMTKLKAVITMEDEIYDVLLDDERFCSFDWSWITLDIINSTTEENSTATNQTQTLPQIRVYDVDGSVRDTRLITNFMVSFISYGGVEGVGWMVDTLTSSYVKWILHSKHDITIRPSTGWGAPELTYFNLYPKRVRPGESVNVSFTLPEGLRTYETNLDDRYLSKFLEGESYAENYEPETKRYTLAFKFRDFAKNNVFTISVYAEKHGVPYQSSEKITVLPSLTEVLVYETVIPIIVVIGVLIFIVLLIRWLYYRRKMGPPPIKL